MEARGRGSEVGSEPVGAGASPKNNKSKRTKDAAKHTSKRWTSSGASAAPSRAIDEAGEKKMAVADAITSKSRAIASTCAFDRSVARLRAQR